MPKLKMGNSRMMMIGIDHTLTSLHHKLIAIGTHRRLVSRPRRPQEQGPGSRPAKVSPRQSCPLRRAGRCSEVEASVLLTAGLMKPLLSVSKPRYGVFTSTFLTVNPVPASWDIHNIGTAIRDLFMKSHSRETCSMFIQTKGKPSKLYRPVPVP